MIGNYLQLYQPKIGKLLETLEKEKFNSEDIMEFINILNERDKFDSVKWSLNRISCDLPIFHYIWDYVDNLRGSRFEVQSPLNEMHNNLYLRLLKNKEIPSEFNLFGELLIPESLYELYELTNQKKTKVLISEGNSKWQYPIPGIIKKLDEDKYFLEF
jgi:hypothetical protein